ncbi:carbohydrate ABC transporter substrate-binding protein, CUT1 family (TC 3.A.1.1.-) [Fictibacillus solisalsi]|uniref:Carbohydrate ABC transporter substrate-binding protein, CUT1 family (TC 3.A.1.1.-) n=1 Tax=Fictibacillus solisalsi TaxID=459525 RepID=A0A1G9XC78_9BACL|nr:ABC transporter substrate-binding protein [Fictibacillus solisalsi]SDM93913.1 carbohydrate ABC transporter substrate-binding protein, CUT1 family (TC 3.A.1.1.-) [Fictibacillus solisalsi]
MKLKKYVSTAGLTALLATSLLAGCSHPGESENSSKTVITLSGWGGNPVEKKLLEGVLDDFEKSHPNIDVKFNQISDQYMDVLKTRLIGGTAADVFYLDAFEAPGLIETGAIEPLDKYVTDDFDVDDFEKPMLDAFKDNGKIYGFPKDYSTLALFYNKKMFREAGIGGPPKTWEELERDAKKLTKGNKVYGLGVMPQIERLYYMAESEGGQVITNDRATFAEDRVSRALQPILDMHLKDKTAAQASEVGSGSGGEMFGQGRAAMVMEGNWNIPFMKDTFPQIEYGTAELPTVNGKKGTMSFTVGYAMNAESKHKKASWELIKYLTGKEGMKTWTSKGFALPTRKSVAEELGYDKDPLRGPLVKGAEYATVWQDGPMLPIVMNNFNNQFLSAYLGERPLKKALKDAQKQANKEIKVAE